MKSLLSPHNRLFVLAQQGQRSLNFIIAISLVIGVVFIAQGIGSLALTLLGFVPSNDPNLDRSPTSILGASIEFTLLLILLFSPIFLFVWLIVHFFEKRPWWTTGLSLNNAPRPYYAFWLYAKGFLVGGLLFSGALGLLGGMGFLKINASPVQSFGFLSIGTVGIVLIGWVVQGAAEEYLFRGWLLPILSVRYTPWIGILVSTILFALFHLFNPSAGPIALINLCLFGFFAGLYALYEEGVWGVFGLHTAWNWVQGNVFSFPVSGLSVPGGPLLVLNATGPQTITGGQFGLEGGLAVTVILTIACLIIIWLAQQRNLTNRASYEL